MYAYKTNTLNTRIRISTQVVAPQYNFCHIIIFPELTKFLISINTSSPTKNYPSIKININNITTYQYNANTHIQKVHICKSAGILHRIQRCQGWLKPTVRDGRSVSDLQKQYEITNSQIPTSECIYNLAYQTYP